ncbi:MAG: GNAT family N-acetyltransferase [Acidobacteriota bacterium]|nr:GNAT family N-acetyltransferase [Acidobacteriota bacterium]
MDAEFRSATLADEEILINLRRGFCEIETFPNPLDEATNRAVLLQLIENEQFGKIWLILVEGEAAGYIVLAFGYSLEYAGRDALIDELYLREKFRGFGLGKQTLQFVEDYCRSENIRAIHLEVDRTNIAAKTLYHKNGFVDHERHFLTKWIK